MLWSILTLLIGVLFIISLLSLLATTAMESIAGMMRLRGKNLERALRNMLSPTDVNQVVYHNFIDHSLYRQLAKDPGHKGSKPSYMRREDFQTILLDLLARYNGGPIHDAAALQAAVDQLPDVDLKNTLTSLIHESHGDMNRFRTSVQSWYDSVMERAGGWYKRTTKRILFGLGLLMAVGFNADTINIFYSLQSNPENMQQVMSMANAFLGQPPVTAAYSGNYSPAGQAQPYTPPAAPQAIEPYQSPGAAASNTPAGMEPYQPPAASSSNPALQPYQPPAGRGQHSGIYGVQLADVDQEEKRAYLQQMVLRELQSAQSPFGIGWSDFQFEGMTTDSWLLKLLGWFITALAISFGSPFWFDVLRKVANVSSSGRVN